MWPRRKSLERRLTSGAMALLMLTMSVLGRVNVIPAYAVDDIVKVESQIVAKNDIEIMVESDGTGAAPGESFGLNIKVRNNTELSIDSGSLKVIDRSDLLEEEMFGTIWGNDTAVLSEDESTVEMISLAPGKVFEVEYFADALEDITKADNGKLDIVFEAKQSEGKLVHGETEWTYSVGAVELQPAALDADEYKPGQIGVMTLSIRADEDRFAEAEADADEKKDTLTETPIFTITNQGTATNDTVVTPVEESETDTTLTEESTGVVDNNIETGDTVIEDEETEVPKTDVPVIEAETTTPTEETAEPTEEAKAEVTLTTEAATPTEETTAQATEEENKAEQESEPVVVNVETTSAPAEETTQETPAAEPETEKLENEVTIVPMSVETPDLQMALDVDDLDLEAVENIASGSDAVDGVASDANADEVIATSINKILYTVQTSGVELENVAVTDVALTDSSELIAEIQFQIPKEAEAGTYYGNVHADVEIDGKNYKADQGFELVVIQGLTDEQLAEVQRVIDMINQLPPLEEMMTKAQAFMDAEDAEGFNEYAQEIARVAQPAYEAYMALSPEQQALVTNIDVLMNSAAIWSAVTLATGDKIAKIDKSERGINENITLNLFNYGSEFKAYPGLPFNNKKQNDDANAIDGFYSGWAWTTAKKTNTTLSPDSPYPSGADFDTKNLFSPTHIEENDITYNDYLTALQNATSEKGTEYGRFRAEVDGDGGLFKKDAITGYYSYDSKINAASYNYNTKTFDVYDGSVKPFVKKNSYTTDNDENTVSAGNFLPFNDASDSTWTKYYSSVPIDNYTLNEAEKTDLWFGMSIEFDFYMPKDGLVNGDPMEFDFFGDDDVWVYVDDVLVLDIGGMHAARGGSINFATGEVNNPNIGGSVSGNTLDAIFRNAGVESNFDDYTSHNLKFFYLERGGNISYCRLKFNMPTLPKGSLMVGKDLEFVTENGTVATILDEDAKAFAKENIEYTFSVKRSDTHEVMFANSEVQMVTADGTPIKDADGNIKMVKIDSQGRFKLKADERVLFTDIELDSDEEENIKKQYYVEEYIPEEYQYQYQNVVFQNGELQAVDVDNDNAEVSYKTPNLTNDSTHVVVYTNQVNADAMGKLAVEKKVESSVDTTDQTFAFEVKVDGRLVEEGTEFELADGTEINADENGIIKLAVGQKATMVNPLIAGTRYSVQEILTEEQISDKWERARYDVTLAMINADGTSTPGQPVQNKADVVSGEIKVNAITTVTAVNQKSVATISLDKVVTGNKGDQTKEFMFTVTAKVDGVEKVKVTRTLTGQSGAEQIEVPLGAQVEIKEVYTQPSTEQKYDASATVDGVSQTVNAADPVVSETDTTYTNSISFTATNDPAKVQTVVFTNHKATTKITLDKVVTGTLGDRSRKFDFDVVVKVDGNVINTVKVALNDTDRAAEIEVPENAVIEISETYTDVDAMTTQKYHVSAKVNNADADVKETETKDTANGTTTYVNAMSFTAAAGTELYNVVFTNNKEARPDTGIALDSLPYILILGAVIAGVAFFVLRKRKENDFE